MILVIINIFVFGLKWYFLVKLWTSHMEFFKKNSFIYTEEPNVLYQIRLIVTIIFHDLAHKFVTYFYFARYKPLFMGLTFWTIADLVQDVFLALVPLILIGYTRLRIGLFNTGGIRDYTNKNF